MTPSKQDDAALFVLGLMGPEESRVFEQELRADPELARLVDELRETTAELAHTAPTLSPPASLKTRLMEQIASESRGPKTTPSLAAHKKAKGGPWTTLGWGIAAMLAITCAILGLQLQRTKQQAVTLQTQLQTSLAETEASNGALNRLREQNSLSRMEIATLRSSLEEYKQGVAVVVWDSNKRQGVLKLEKMPPLDPQKDYQLWVVDTKNPAPVDAGVVKVDQSGFAQVDFKPVDPVSEATKFALSVERKGGVPRGEGPIVLIGP
jgi:anti-sigma-K factor RskA